MDVETAVRERVPILSILLNNFSMAIELKMMPVSTPEVADGAIVFAEIVMHLAEREVQIAAPEPRRCSRLEPLCHRFGLLDRDREADPERRRGPPSRPGTGPFSGPVRAE